MAKKQLDLAMFDSKPTRTVGFSEGKHCAGCGVMFTPICYRPPHGFYVKKSRETCGSPECIRLARNRKGATRRKFSKGTACRHCGVLFTPVRYEPSQRSFHVRKRQACPTCCEKWGTGKGAAISASLIGKPKPSVLGAKHWNWRGGQAENVGRGRKREWKETCAKVRKSQKYRCGNPECGKSETELGYTLHVHHKVPFHSFLTVKEANKRSNLVALCAVCHKKAEMAIEAAYQMRLELFGRQGVLRGSRQPNSKLTEEAVLEIRVLRANGNAAKDIAKKFGIDPSTVSNICSGDTWQHVGGPLTWNRRRSVTSSDAAPKPQTEFALD